MNSFLRSISLRTISIASICFTPAFALAAPPSAGADSRTVPANTKISINVLDNDSDPDGDTLTLVSVSQPMHGSTAINSDGGVAYMPAANYVGTDTFSYIVRDNSEAAQQAVGQVTITVTAAGFVNYAPNGNAKNIAQVLDSVCQDFDASQNSDTPVTLTAAQLKLAEQCDNFSRLKISAPNALAKNLQQISPQHNLALTSAAFSSAQAQSRILGAHQHQIGDGIQAISVNGLSFSQMATGGAAGDDLISDYGFFMSAELEDADRKETALESGFDFKANTLITGIDRNFTDKGYVGIATGFTQNKLDYLNNGGNVDAQTYSLIGYGAFLWGHFTLDAQLGYMSLDFDVTRKIQLGDESGVVTSNSVGNTKGDQVLAALNVDYGLEWSALTVNVYANLLVTDTQVDGYAEVGDTGFDIALEDQEFSQQKLTLGARSQYAINTAFGVVTPMANIGWVSHLNDDVNALRGHFLGDIDPTYFSVEGDSQKVDYFDAGIGVGFVVINGVSSYFSLDKTLGYDNYSSSRIQAGFRLEI